MSDVPSDLAIGYESAMDVLRGDCYSLLSAERQGVANAQFPPIRAYVAELVEHNTTLTTEMLALVQHRALAERHIELLTAGQQFGDPPPSRQRQAPPGPGGRAEETGGTLRQEVGYVCDTAVEVHQHQRVTEDRRRRGQGVGGD